MTRWFANITHLQIRAPSAIAARVPSLTPCGDGGFPARRYLSKEPIQTRVASRGGRRATEAVGSSHESGDRELGSSARFNRRLGGRDRVVRFSARLLRADMVGQLIARETVREAFVDFRQHRGVPF